MPCYCGQVFRLVGLGVLGFLGYLVLLGLLGLLGFLGLLFHPFNITNSGLKK